MKNKNGFYYFTLFFVIILLFVILTPKLSIKIFPFLRKQKFKQFNNYLLTTKNFNPQVFWQFREFFCPGYFEVKKNGFEDNAVEKEFDFLNKNNDKLLNFAIYNCSYLKSFENLTENNNLFSLINIDLIKKNYKILAQNQEFIYFKEKTKNNYYLVFLVNNQKMQQTVGFFDYKEKDYYISNFNWLNFSKFTLYDQTSYK